MAISETVIKKKQSSAKDSAFRDAIDWPSTVASTLKRNDGIINICTYVIDRHLPKSADKVALRFISKNWPNNPEAVRDYTYGEVQKQAQRFANGLKGLGLKKGDAVFALSPRIPELYFAVLGSLRCGAVFSPLFSAFGPEPIAARLTKGNAKAIFSLASYYRKKLAPIRSLVPTLQHIILVDDDGSLRDLMTANPSIIDARALLSHSSDEQFVCQTGPEDLALLHFTSGTTGKPKGAAHVHGAVIYHERSAQFALDLKPKDIFWCTADPGWVTGMSYGILAPLANGTTLVIDEAEFLAPRWYQILSTFKVTVWYTAPTAMRMLMKAGDELAQSANLSNVRFAASVGEPLNPEVISWTQKNLKVPLHDNWWQSETGGIMISNYHDMDIKLGSMGRPMPGIEIKLIKRTDVGGLAFVEKPGEQGEIAIKKGWPSMFRAYLGDEDRYKKCFNGDWYLSGDMAYSDEDGYFWFVGRADDVIKSSGHLIGPFEVESVLMEHPAVLESGVIGKPDPMAGELVKAFVALKAGHSPSEDLRLDILAHARKRLGVAVAPREIAFIESLPKTRSGKIMRRLLKARELGLPEGDLSTLETTS